MVSFETRLVVFGIILLTLLASACGAAEESSQEPPTADTRWDDERERMVANTIEARGVEDATVLRAMRSVPRHLFVPEEYRDLSYADRPLPIGYGQTISQPYIVAWMTELLELREGERVLEIGTGSGYQAAVLTALGYVEVYSIEIVPELAERAASLLDELGYDVTCKQGDGYYGWEEHAPYDAIIVTAAPDHLPQSLVEQLVEGGRIVVPIGPPGGYQSLWRFRKVEGEVEARNLGGVRFVPLTGEHGAQERSWVP
ncbi:MAG: protein-L-isoaspartate(D-aspartate) O-methyltransferase [Anaerolineae bacterium]